MTGLWAASHAQEDESIIARLTTELAQCHKKQKEYREGLEHAVQQMRNVDQKYGPFAEFKEWREGDGTA